MKRRAGVTQTRDTLFQIRVSINTSNLRRDVRANAQSPARELVCQFKGEQIQIGAQSCQERIAVFEKWGKHELVTPASVKIEQITTQSLHGAGLFRQHFFNRLR